MRCYDWLDSCFGAKPLHVLPVPVRSLNRVKPLLIVVEQSELTLSYRQVLLVRNTRPQDVHALMGKLLARSRNLLVTILRATNFQSLPFHKV